MIKYNRKAQSTLEYVIALTAIVGVILYAAVTWIKPAAQKTINDSSAAIENAADRFNVTD